MGKGKGWYSPREIHFTRQEALWLIRHLPALREGSWPTQESGYTDIAQILKQGGHKAPFETAIEFAAEISMRLEACREDGLILLAMECWGESEYALARYLRKPEWSIIKRAKRALRYVASGPAIRWHDSHNKHGELKRKAETYQEFKGSG